MIKIGDFAKIFDISIKTVRFYEEKGLIVPAFIDIYSGYRYYDESNVDEMSKILFLKNLGFSLNEIKNFSENDIKNKIKDYKIQISKIKDNIYTLETLSKNESGVKKMRTFINDEDAIGKWKLIGIAKTKEDFLNNKLLNPNDEENDDVTIKELYLMEDGKEYWVISWTKGFIYVGMDKNEYPYEIENDLMYVKFIDPMNSDNYKIVVYKRLDRKKYTLDEITHKDNIDIPFEKDENLVGFWKSVDFVPNPEAFVPNKKYYKNVVLYLEKLSVSPEGEVIVSFKGGNIKNTRYSKNYIINLVCNNTLCKYVYKYFNDKAYIIIEWKSGDYIYGNMILRYYVLEKIN